MLSINQTGNQDTESVLKGLKLLFPKPNVDLQNKKDQKQKTFSVEKVI